VLLATPTNRELRAAPPELAEIIRDAKRGRFAYSGSVLAASLITCVQSRGLTAWHDKQPILSASKRSPRHSAEFDAAKFFRCLNNFPQCVDAHFYFSFYLQVLAQVIIEPALVLWVARIVVIHSIERWRSLLSRHMLQHARTPEFEVTTLIDPT
jgi:hypothetical protein